jgi:hypothetical protein
MQPDEAPAIASVRVLDGSEPVRLVTRHGDGSWDFLCNTTASSQDLVTVHAGHIFELLPDLAELRDLAPGHLAEREEPGGRWRRELDLDLR